MLRTQNELACDLAAARAQTDALFRLVRPDSLYHRPIPERHRIIFYLGHLEAFDWNLMARNALGRPSFHPTFDRLFAFGIDPPPGRSPSDQPSDWPSLAEVERYNHRTRDEIDDWLGEVPEQLQHAAIEHRLMHAETFAYILHQLSYERKAPPPMGALPAARNAPREGPEWCQIGPGTVGMGKRPEEGFGWDNEFQAHTVDVPGFSIGRYKVTNGDYLEYVRDGAAAPFFWAERGGRWFYRGMFAETPLTLDWPVYVTWEQADAYARWRGSRLPDEPEWQRAAVDAYPSDNLDFRHWDPVPVTAGDRGGAAPVQMYGNGWEWTASVFAPFPGFEPFPFYPNYSDPFFDGRHYVLKGASPRTAACFLRPSFRNWFRPAYPYVYATFRLVQS
ncbi:MAG TPA: SUMF1/EgtB/PvdO family nonheme iron enzyme [Bryobacteraceae bacterium]|nr:SUMF1/EgtB/PvdO family nonheme iron enzyme [Bryobacteraceae bacterium]